MKIYDKNIVVLRNIKGEHHQFFFILKYIDKPDNPSQQTSVTYSSCFRLVVDT